MGAPCPRGMSPLGGHVMQPTRAVGRVWAKVDLVSLCIFGDYPIFASEYCAVGVVGVRKEACSEMMS